MSSRFCCAYRLTADGQIDRPFRFLVAVCLLFASLAFSGPRSALAQVPQESIYPTLTGQALIDQLKADYSPNQTLGYDVARDELYRYLDTERGVLECVYGGYSVDIPQGEDPSSFAYQNGSGISAEHTWPQSKGAGSEPQKSDMHALYPVKQTINSARSNYPYADITDTETDTWYYDAQSQSTVPSSSIDAWSERDGTFPSNANYSSRFEPRESHKGNAARAMFYFYVIHNSTISDPNFFEAQKETLIDWHNQDFVDVNESDRNLWIATKQGTENPFIADTTLVRRVFEPTSGPTVQFLASSSAVAETDGSVTLTVELQNADGTAIDVDVALRAGSSTAGADDFGNYTTQTVSFAASATDGATQTLTIPITDDATPEVDESGIFALENVTGSAVAGAPSSHEVTVLDDDGTLPRLLISQYAEDGDIKGIELWNSGSTTIDFSSTPLAVNRYSNGSTSATTDVSINTGTLTAGDVLVIADDAANSIWSTLGITYQSAALQFNGNDAIEVVLDGQTTDVLGTIGSDPGTAWTGSGVSTADQNIALRGGITSPDPDGWTDPSTRFATNSTAPLDDGTGGDLNAFGYAPGDAPCPVPDAQPTSLSLTAGATFIDGIFSEAASGDTYLVVRSTSSSLSAGPADGTSYGTGDALGGGTVVQMDPATTFTASGLTSETTYTTFVYSAGTTSRIGGACAGGPVYRGSAPLAGSATTSASSGSTALLYEPFDDATQYTFGSGQSDARDGSDNYFTRTDGTAINKTYDGVNGPFFAGQDIDDPQVLDTATPGTLTWSDVPIDGVTNLQFSARVGEVLDGTGDIDNNDYLLFEYRVDGGAWQRLLAFENDGASYNTVFYEDTDFDGTGDGTGISSSQGTLVEFTKPISASGSSLDLRFTAGIDAGDEDFAIDDIEITGDSGIITATSGDLIITEVMQNPDDISDSNGEYFEVYNTTDQPIDMDGWTIRDDDIDSHVIASSVVVPPGGYGLFCRTTAAASSCSYTFGGDMAIANGGDEIELVNGSGSVIERIAYDGGSQWPDPTGAAMVYTGTRDGDTNDGVNWIEATVRQAAFDLNTGTDLGSPGIRGRDQHLDVVQTSDDIPGWRLMAAPVPGLTVQWLIDNGAHVQGITQNAPGGDPNVYVRYDGPQDATSAEHWRAATDATDALETGWGFIWNPLGMSLPTTFRTTAQSTLPQSDFTLSGIPMDEQWHLVGNPFPNPIAVDAIDLAGQNFSTTLQVWDPSASSGAGTYRLLTQGVDMPRLAPMAGAWAQRQNPTGTSTSLTFSASGQSLESAPFYKSSPAMAESGAGASPGYVQLTLTGYNSAGSVETVDKAATLLMHDDAASGRDVYDAVKLSPIAAAYAAIAFDGTPDDPDALRSVASFPYPSERQDAAFDVVVGGAPDVDRYTLSWSGIEIPSAYEVSLVDRATGTVTDLRNASTYDIPASSADAKTKSLGRNDVTGHGLAVGSDGVARPVGVPLRRTRPAITSGVQKSETSSQARFALVISNGPLPVEMADFMARVNDAAAILEWSTLSEETNEGFQVEHRAPGGVFRDIGFVHGAGSTTQLQRYTFETGELAFGRHEFRLRQIDMDGTASVSQIVTVQIQPDEPIAIEPPAPHPVETQAVVTVMVKPDVEASVHLYDLLGRRVQVLHDGPVSSDGLLRLTLDASSLPSGMYFLRASGGGSTATERITVVR